jgi:hypothetical protein
MLKLLYTIPNAAGLGEYKVSGAVAGSPITVQGGLVGRINTETSVAGEPDFVSGVKARRAVISLAPEATAAQLPTVGLIDDSSTGVGYGTPFGSYYGSQAISTSTMEGSKKCTLHILPGVYMTNTFDVAETGWADAAALSVITPGTAIYSLATSAIISPTAGGSATQIGNFIEVVRLRDLYKVSPSVLGSTFGTNSDTFIVIKFK